VHVLIVEDERRIAAYVKRGLEEEGAPSTCLIAAGRLSSGRAGRRSTS
jgi:DNA-binding response OmpR family regulator